MSAHLRNPVEIWMSGSKPAGFQTSSASPQSEWKPNHFCSEIQGISFVSLLIIALPFSNIPEPGSTYCIPLDPS